MSYCIVLSPKSWTETLSAMLSWDDEQGQKLFWIQSLQNNSGLIYKAEVEEYPEFSWTSSEQMMTSYWQGNNTETVVG